MVLFLRLCVNVLVLDMHGQADADLLPPLAWLQVGGKMAQRENLFSVSSARLFTGKQSLVNPRLGPAVKNSLSLVSFAHQSNNPSYWKVLL